MDFLRAMAELNKGRKVCRPEWGTPLLKPYLEVIDNVLCILGTHVNQEIKYCYPVSEFTASCITAQDWMTYEEDEDYDSSNDDIYFITCMKDDRYYVAPGCYLTLREATNYALEYARRGCYVEVSINGPGLGMYTYLPYETESTEEKRLKKMKLKDEQNRALI